ncbi:MAG: hypothetical protein Harvfovirus12_11 [Harvfovirus sp.]|uniref:Endonuclease/exonuclease/phosphatase domain-containing protein n=1 Tax=Harvfovirus sp. TaxID=2487768 RepID=A0A3G5A196_9VIRU|nr:MAG: hypothetical protein Harvfovirus12_11 [Harvfovirus sp.]
MIFRIASLCSNPICKVHEYIWYSFATKTRLNFSIRAAIILFSPIILILALLGIILRFFGVLFQKEPFIHSRQRTKPPDPPTILTILSWNICCVAGGYSISDGGVIPWASRIDSVINTILTENHDIVCLFETFDTDSAFYLTEKLKYHYYDFYFNIGAKAIGTSSGIFVASKFKISNAAFMPFNQNHLIGRTKYCGKGIFSFQIGTGYATIFPVHLQHSEIVSQPTKDEISARKNQMNQIIEQIGKIKSGATLVIGDFNLDDREYEAASWNHIFQKDDHFYGKKTWGGDHFCASLVNKPASDPLNLDHAIILKGTAKKIHTTLRDTAFDGKSFNKEALSDHAILKSTLTL